MYRGDNSDRFPSFPSNWVGFQYGGGDPDRSNQGPEFIAATKRPLWPYVSVPEVFHCAADRGMDLRPDGSGSFKDTFRMIGTSYSYNSGPWWKTKEKLADPDKGLAEKPTSWVPDPARHILLCVWYKPAR